MAQPQIITEDKGGTVATTVAQARINLGLEIGVDVQPYSANLDTWEAKTAPDGEVVGDDDVQTLSNKIVVKRVATTTDDATAVIDTDSYDVYELTAIANDTTFTLTGTPNDKQTLIVAFKDAGVAKNLTWTGFTAIGVTLPAVTTANKWCYVGCIYNAAATTWHAVAVNIET